MNNKIVTKTMCQDKNEVINYYFTILTSGNSKFDLEMHESLLISKLKPILKK